MAAKASQVSNVAIVIASPEGLSAESKLNTTSAIVSGSSQSKKNPSLTSVDILGLGTGSDLEKKLKYTKDVCSGIILGTKLDNDSAEDETNHDGNSEMNYVKSFKGFHLLNACR
ncbi:hypothetical protein RHGRI_007859 [Rhododendron griersonianum]|uniref:Uncharacterized protein n=1 Tax=Rhododendron griersonianum TaxID=479676 RepID=A0AAV6L1A2_9ERIC|nr:hypothetical protein RHGRI_007859 [Rhododendron griersonianum]